MVFNFCFVICTGSSSCDQTALHTGLSGPAGPTALAFGTRGASPCGASRSLANWFVLVSQRLGVSVIYGNSDIVSGWCGCVPVKYRGVFVFP